MKSTSNNFYLTFMFILASTNTSDRQPVVFFIFFFIKNAPVSQYSLICKMPKYLSLHCKIDRSINSSTSEKFSAVSILKKKCLPYKIKRSDISNAEIFSNN